MFIQDQSNKVLFNMLDYKIKKMDSCIGIFNKQEEYLGVLAEYSDPVITQNILNEIVYLMKYCNMNKIFCVYKFPSESDMKDREVIKNKIK